MVWKIIKFHRFMTYYTLEHLLNIITLMTSVIGSYLV